MIIEKVLLIDNGTHGSSVEHYCVRNTDKNHWFSLTLSQREERKKQRSFGQSSADSFMVLEAQDLISLMISNPSTWWVWLLNLPSSPAMTFCLSLTCIQCVLGMYSPTYGFTFCQLPVVVNHRMNISMGNSRNKRILNFKLYTFLRNMMVSHAVPSYPAHDMKQVILCQSSLCSMSYPPITP